MGYKKQTNIGNQNLGGATLLHPPPPSKSATASGSQQKVLDNFNALLPLNWWYVWNW